MFQTKHRSCWCRNWAQHSAVITAVQAEIASHVNRIIAMKFWQNQGLLRKSVYIFREWCLCLREASEVASPRVLTEWSSASWWVWQWACVQVRKLSRNRDNHHVVSGALFGGLSCWRAGLRGGELIQNVGKVMVQGGGTFGTFMSIGTAIRC